MSLLDAVLLLIITAVFVIALKLAIHGKKERKGSCGCGSCDSCKGCSSKYNKADKGFDCPQGK